MQQNRTTPLTRGLTLLTLCGTMALGGVALAQDGDRERDRDQRREHREDRRGDRAERREMREDARHRMMKTLFGNLELEDQQKKDIREIMQDFREKAMDWRDEHKEELADLRRRMLQAQRERDRGAAVDAYRDLLELTESRPQAEDAFDRVREVLNEQQTERFNENLEAMRERAKQRMQQRGIRADRERGERGERARRGDRGDREARAERRERREERRDRDGD